MRWRQIVFSALLLVAAVAVGAAIYEVEPRAWIAILLVGLFAGRLQEIIESDSEVSQ